MTLFVDNENNVTCAYCIEEMTISRRLSDLYENKLIDRTSEQIGCRGCVIQKVSTSATQLNNKITLFLNNCVFDNFLCLMSNVCLSKIQLF